MAGIRYKGQIFSGSASFGDADHVAYDNTDSGLTSTNVQDALDEVSTNKANVKTVRVTQTTSYTVTSNMAPTSVLFGTYENIYLLNFAGGSSFTVTTIVEGDAARKATVSDGKLVLNGTNRAWWFVGAAKLTITESS